MPVTGPRHSTFARRHVRKGAPAIGAIIGVGAGLMAVVAIVGVVIAFSGVIESTYMKLAFETPGFDYGIVDGEESGNELLEVYQSMRLVAIGIFVVVLIFGGVSRVLESADMGVVATGTANKMMTKSMLFLIIIFIFPPMWDMSAEAMTNISYWVLNPIYSFNPDQKCPAQWGYIGDTEVFDQNTYDLRVHTEFMNSKYVLTYEKALAGGMAYEVDPKDKIPPTVTSAIQGDGNNIIITLSESVIVADQSLITVEVSGDERTLLGVPAGEFTNTLLVSYSGSSHTGIATVDIGEGAISDLNGNLIAATSSQASPKVTDGPTFVSAVFSGPGQFEVIFSERIKPTPSKADFEITIEGEDTPRIIEGVEVTGTGGVVVKVDFGGSVTNVTGKAATVQLGYGIVDMDGNPLYGLSPGETQGVSLEPSKFTNQFGKRHDPATEGVGLVDKELVCDPQLKLRYIFKQMLTATEDTHVTAPQQAFMDEIKSDILEPDTASLQTTNNWLGDWQNTIIKGGTDFMLNIFLGLTKALIALQILIMAIMIGIMTDLLVAMVVGALPIFLMLSLVPRADQFANKMLDSLPALLMIPLMASIIVVTGAAAVAESGDGLEDQAKSHIYTWITSIGVVFFAITIPVILVPMIGQVSSMATQMVSSAVQTGAMVTGMAASGMGSALRDHSKLPSTGGIAGYAKAGLMGLGAGALASQGKIGMPGLSAGGVSGMNMNMGEIGRGIESGIDVGHGVDPKASGLPSEEKMNATIDDSFKKVRDHGHTEYNSKELARVTGDKEMEMNREDFDRTGQIARIDERIANLSEEQLNKDGVRDAINEWNGKYTGAINDIKAGKATDEQIADIGRMITENDKNLQHELGEEGTKLVGGHLNEMGKREQSE